MLFNPIKRYYILSCSIVVVLHAAAGCNSNNSTKHPSSTRKDTTAVIKEVVQAGLDTAGYRVYQSFQPQMLLGNKQVTVCLLLDIRLTGPTAEVNYFPLLHAAQLIFHSDEEALNPEAPKYRAAILLMTGGDGRIISYSILDIPFARIDTTYLDEKQTSLVYLFTLDYSIGLGSYAGAATYFVAFADTGMVNYNSDNAFAGTLKAAWAMRYTDGRMEVWQKKCRPADNDNFNITTEKTVWHDGAFKMSRVTKKGYWDVDGRDGSESSMKEFFNDFSE